MTHWIQERMLPNFLYLIIGSFFTIVSCSKKENEASSNEPARLTISVAGIEGNEDVLFTQSKASVIDRENLSNGVIKENTIQFDNSQAMVSSEQTGMETSMGRPVTGLSKAAIRKGAALMQDGIKYLILLYEQGNGTFVKAAQATSGSSLEIEVWKNKRYKWYAYSYNEVVDISIPTNTSNPAIETPIDKDLLYASGEISVGETNAALPITFKHKLAMALVSINSKGMSANISSIQASFQSASYFNKGTLNLITGIVSNIQSYQTGLINFADSIPGASDVMIAKYYTADPSNLTTYGIRISTLSVKMSDNTIRQLITPLLPRNVSFGTFQPLIGKRLKGNLNLISNGVVVSGITWAMGNLYYDNGNYKIRPSQSENYFSSCNDYWRFRSMTPAGPPNQGDPCRKVYPENTWRLPTQAEITTLAFDRGTGNLNGVPFIGYVQYRSDNDLTRFLRLNLGGQMSSLGHDCTILNTTDGFYWSSTATTLSHAYALEVEDNAGVLPGWAKVRTLSIDDRISIRCIKNN